MFLAQGRNDCRRRAGYCSCRHHSLGTLGYCVADTSSEVMEEAGLCVLLELIHSRGGGFYVVASVGRAVRPADSSVLPVLVVEVG